jgi:hypothetical protein
MTKNRMPTCPKTLQGQSLRAKAREDLNIDELVLLGNVDYFLDSYFLLSAAFEATSHTQYTKIVDSLKALQEYEHFNQNLRRFLQKVYNYVNSMDTFVV